MCCLERKALLEKSQAKLSLCRRRHYTDRCTVMLNLTLSLIFVYFATSCWETFVHWKILHANRNTRLAWKYYGGVFNLLRKACFSHNTIHHVKTYNSNYYVQFNSANKKKSLDSKLYARPHLRIQGDRYGLTISGFWENTVFMAIPIIIAIFIFSLLAIDYVWLGVLIAIIPMMLSKYVHHLLHKENPISKNTSAIMKYFLSSRYFSYIQLYHYIHHQHTLCNFNLMPGGDYLLGVARTLTPKPINNPGTFNLAEYRITKPFSGLTKSM